MKLPFRSVTRMRCLKSLSLYPANQATNERNDTSLLNEVALQVSDHDAVVGGVGDEQAVACQVGGQLACRHREAEGEKCRLLLSKLQLLEECEMNRRLPARSVATLSADQW